MRKKWNGSQNKDWQNHGNDIEEFDYEEEVFESEDDLEDSEEDFAYELDNGVGMDPDNGWNDYDPEEETDFLEEGDKPPIGMILGGVGLLAVIVVLCVLIWGVSHRREDSSPGPEPGSIAASGSTEQNEENESMPQGETSEPEPSGSIPENTEEGPADRGTEGSTIAGGDMAGGEPTDSGSDSSVDMTFQDADDTVTAKDVTNLRSEPSTARKDTVVVQLKHGQTVTRTGINPDTGWSRVEYNGMTLYAVSQYLTAPDDSGQTSGSGGAAGDETVPGAGASDAPVENGPAGAGNPESPVENSSGGDTNNDAPADSNTVVTKDGRTIYFTSCDDVVSPKIEVNLRGEPSTSQGNATVHFRLPYGENVRRTGYDEASGWSRVEYNGETLYAVTSNLFVVEDTQE